MLTVQDSRLGRPLVQGAWLLLVSVIIAAGSWVLRPDALPWTADRTTYELELSAPLVEVSEALELFDAGDHLFIDTRADAAEVEETISGAFLIRESHFDDDLLNLMDDLYPEDPLIIFGNGELSGASNVAARLQTRGYENLLILRVGIDGWLAAGGDLSPPYIPQPYDSDAEGQ